MNAPKCFLLLVFAAAAFAQLPLKQDPNKVVATVDGRDVTWAEVQQILANADPRFSAYFRTDPQAALMQWFIMQHLGKEGDQMKLDQQSPWKEHLEAMRMNILADARLNQEFNAFPVSNEAIKAYYDKNKPRFQRVRVSGIYIKFKPETKQGATSPDDVAAAAQAILQGLGVQRTEAEARTLASDLVKRLRAGEPIQSLAAQYSEDDSTKSKGGDIGYINSTSSMAGEVVKAAMALQQGEISEPIRLPAGFYVLRADERNFEPMADVTGDIVEAIRKEHQNEFLEKLNNRFRPVIQDPTVFIPATAAPGK